MSNRCASFQFRMIRAYSLTLASHSVRRTIAQYVGMEPSQSTYLFYTYIFHTARYSIIPNIRL